jgi:hypothetical protein
MWEQIYTYPIVVNRQQKELCSRSLQDMTSWWVSWLLEANQVVWQQAALEVAVGTLPMPTWRGGPMER